MEVGGRAGTKYATVRLLPTPNSTRGGSFPAKRSHCLHRSVRLSSSHGAQASNCPSGQAPRQHISTSLSQDSPMYPEDQANNAAAIDTARHRMDGASWGRSFVTPARRAKWAAYDRPFQRAATPFANLHARRSNIGGALPTSGIKRCRNRLIQIASWRAMGRKLQSLEIKDTRFRPNEIPVGTSKS